MKIATTSQGTKKAKANSDYGIVIVKGFTVIKNWKAVGTFMASDRGLFRQTGNQEKVAVSSFDEGLKIAQDWLDEIESQVNQELEKVATKLKNKAQEKGYKNGWVYYQMKDFYGHELAIKILGETE